ncbi:uncharacterized protein N7477_010195 [Penicillium maclennaniae]|uniref:uncharacterized protein n=1 Tax=Penicillium maclennaniae TaxID=1343394 RepID=UPI002541061E|nr:uncharacterized protein N7477_010195 [Penicillium maclennaniae]KAJ5662579.1 hypothetical protein N7477_010195 [Penicillium maclennaniae]
MDPNAGFPAGFPMPTQSPQNQMAFYPNSVPQYPQSKTPQQTGQQQHSFGAMPLQPGGPSGAMMPQGFPQQSTAAPMDAFSASFNQPGIPASMPQYTQPGTAPSQPSAVQQTFNQNMATINANMLANQPKPPQMNSQMNSQINSPQTTQPGTPEVVNLQAAGKAGTAPTADANTEQGGAPKPTPAEAEPGIY